MEARGPPRVKNKAAAPVQISAEQLLREAVDRQDEKLKAPTQRIESHEELLEMQARKRKEFEDYIRRNRINVNNFLRYAEWEASQKEMRRARSVLERALDVHAREVVVWLRYIDLEAKNGNVQHARNIIDRACAILPRADKLWYKGVYMEETLGNVEGARNLFSRWLEWEPEMQAWTSYIKLELRYNEVERARAIYERLTIVHPESTNWIRWAKFEINHGSPDLVRDVFQEGVTRLGEEFADEKLFIDWARYEASLGDTERARAIYKLALDRMPRSRSMNLQKAWTKFEKQFGDRDGVDSVILSKRRRHYEELVRDKPKDYDAYLDWAALEEESCTASGDLDRVRECYERAIAEIPPSSDKRHWRRYVYLWIFYALAEERGKDFERTRQIYQQCLSLIPHKSFTFSKVWLMAAEFEIRQGNISAARKLLGRAIGMCPKDKLFRGYIEIEMKLFEFSRVRQLYAKYLEWNSENGNTWIKFAELERGLDDLDRSRAIFEMAVDEPQIDMPELVWKAYIDFEESEGEYVRCRALYERLLQKTDHVKVWTSWAQFEIGVPDDDDPTAADDEDRPISEFAKTRARAVFDRAHKRLKEKDFKEDRVAILSAWRSFEAVHGSKEDQENIEKQMPRKVKKRRKLDDDSFEEYVDYVFPADDESAAKLAKLMANAQKWKQAKAAQQTENGS